MPDLGDKFSQPATRRFDRDFFQNHLVPLVEEWRNHRHLSPTEAIVELTTVRGNKFTIDGIRVAPTWVVVLTEDDEMRLVPMDDVAQIAVRRRPGQPPDKLVGFTRADSVDR